MKNVLKIALPLTIAGLLAACGGGGGTGTGTGGTGSSTSSSTSSTAGSTTTSTTSASGTGGGPTLMEACLAGAMARCARIDACSAGVEITLRYGSMATCVSRFELACEAQHAAPDAGSTPEKSIACANAYPTESCQALWDDDPIAPCTTAPGGRANGAGCAYSTQCQSAYCLIQEGQGCGTCAPKPADGAPCTTGAQCGYDQTCPTATMTCSTYLQQNAACNSAAICGADLFCNSVCTPQATTVGAACDPAKKGCDAHLGLYCDATTKQCQLSTFPGGGQPCDTGTNAARICSASGMCVAGTCVDAAPDGAACNDTSGPPCLGPARCVGGTCKVPDGASCN